MWRTTGVMAVPTKGQWYLSTDTLMVCLANADWDASKPTNVRQIVECIPDAAPPHGIDMAALNQFIAACLTLGDMSPRDAVGVAIHALAERDQQLKEMRHGK